MKVLKVLPRLVVDDLDTAVRAFEAVIGDTATRFSSGDLNLAKIGDLVLAQPPDSKPNLKQIQVVFVVDDVEEVASLLAAQNIEIVEPLGATGIGRRIVARGSATALVEYTELNAQTAALLG